MTPPHLIGRVRVPRLAGLPPDRRARLLAMQGEAGFGPDAMRADDEIHPTGRLPRAPR